MYISILRKINYDSFQDKNTSKKRLLRTGIKCRGSNLCSVFVTKGSKCIGRVYPSLAVILYFYEGWGVCLSVCLSVCLLASWITKEGAASKPRPQPAAWINSFVRDI